MSAHAEAHAHGHHEEHPPEIYLSSRVPQSILGMLLFIGSEAMLFGAFFAALFFVRVVNFASTFYGLTGLHGLHVIIGLLLLLFATIRAFRGHFSPEHHHGLELPGIYWHFVDVMWIVVFITVYII